MSSYEFKLWGILKQNVWRVRYRVVEIQRYRDTASSNFEGFWSIMFDIWAWLPGQMSSCWLGAHFQMYLSSVSTFFNLVANFFFQMYLSNLATVFVKFANVFVQMVFALGALSNVSVNLFSTSPATNFHFQMYLIRKSLAERPKEKLVS